MWMGGSNLHGVEITIPYDIERKFITRKISSQVFPLVLNPSKSSQFSLFPTGNVSFFLRDRQKNLISLPSTLLINRVVSQRKNSIQNHDYTIIGPGSFIAEINLNLISGSLTILILSHLLFLPSFQHVPVESYPVFLHDTEIDH
jgi:hypothetical protein